MKIKKSYLYISLILTISGCAQSDQSVSENNNAESSAVHVSSHQGTEWNVFGVKITGKIMSSQTNGEYSVILTETPPNGGPPKHVHAHEDELFYILQGTFLFHCGDQQIEASQGDFIRLPKGIPHSFVNTDSNTGITMNTITPGGFENFFNEIAMASKNTSLTKHKVDSIANTFGVTFVKN